MYASGRYVHYTDTHWFPLNPKFHVENRRPYTTRRLTVEMIGKARRMRELAELARCRGDSIGFVPTMGALHDGHVLLIETAAQENQVTICSIYVNPSQFAPSEDYSRYPRHVEADVQRASDAGADILFTPSDDEMYPAGLGGQAVWVDPGRLASTLCGASRPGHFQGVATIVGKLFNIVHPHRAYFGQKDAQQAAIVGALVRDLLMDVKVCMVETVREADGLALSSRNLYLSATERKEAAALKRGLDQAAAAFASGEHDAPTLEALVRSVVARDAPEGRIDYVQAVDSLNMQPIHGTISNDALLALAVYFGSTRLIDNIILRPA